MLTVREIVVFSMLGALTFCSKLLMEWAPNVHFIDLFLITFTVVYRKKALFLLGVFVFLTIAFNEALRKANEAMETRMGEVTGGMNLPGIPGLGF